MLTVSLDKMERGRDMSSSSSRGDSACGVSICTGMFEKCSVGMRICKGREGIMEQLIIMKATKANK